MKSARKAIWILIVMAIIVFAVVPILQTTLGSSPYLWGTVTLVVAFFAWILYRRAIAPPKAWRSEIMDKSGQTVFVQLRESRRRAAGVGAFRVHADGVQIDFPDREELFLSWGSIATVTITQEPLGRKWRLQINLLDDGDPVILYPLTEDGVSMATGVVPAERLLQSINAGRPPLRGRG